MINKLHHFLKIMIVSNYYLQNRVSSLVVSQHYTPSFVAQAATGFYFFFRKKSKQKNSQPKKLTFAYFIVLIISKLKFDALS